MFRFKCVIEAMVFLIALVTATAARSDDEKKEERIEVREGIIKTVDFGRNQLVVSVEPDKLDLVVETDAKTEILSGKRPHKIADLKVGMNAWLSYRGESKVAFKIETGWPTLEADLKSLDVGKKRLGIKAEGENGVETVEVFNFIPEVAVVVDALPAGLADLTLGKKVWLDFSPDKKTIYGIEAEADPEDLSAHIKSLSGNSIVLTVSVNGFRDVRNVELKFEIAADAKVRYEGKDIKLAELKPEQRVRCRFAEDRKTIKAIWAASAPPKEEPGK